MEKQGLLYAHERESSIGFEDTASPLDVPFPPPSHRRRSCAIWIHVLLVLVNGLVSIAYFNYARTSHGPNVRYCKSHGDGRA